MSNYTQKQETEIVKDSMTLTTAIQIDQEELKKQKCEQFKSKPAAPYHKKLEVPTVTVKMPPDPKTNYSFVNYLKDNTMYILISIICWPFIIYAFYQYTKRKSEMEEQLKQTPDYKKAVEDAKKKAEQEQQQINDDFAKQQADIDAKYQSDIEHYNTVVIPNYNKELDAWKITHKLKITMLEDELQLNKETLEALYETTRLISLDYRELWILRWLYDDMRTSDHDITRAIDLFNAKRQYLATECAGDKIANAINDMHSTMISGFNAVYDAIDEGNEELAKMRRDQNIANTAGIIQRHNLQKMIKSQNGMLDKYFNK